jgi:hypothetical protein
MFEQAFKNIDDFLWKEAGCTTELDYTEQSSWLLFLKYLNGLEQYKATEAALAEKSYTYILDKPYLWESWAAPGGVGLRARPPKTSPTSSLVPQASQPVLKRNPVSTPPNPIIGLHIFLRVLYTRSQKFFPRRGRVSRSHLEAIRNYFRERL